MNHRNRSPQQSGRRYRTCPDLLVSLVAGEDLNLRPSGVWADSPRSAIYLDFRRRSPLSGTSGGDVDREDGCARHHF
jgi:hypothetical protein